MPSENEIINVILDILARRESNNTHVKTSPTAVCEELHNRGFTCMAGRSWSQRPIRDVFDYVWDVACENFSCEIRGNCRVIRI